MIEQINSVINEHLPKQVGDQLQERLRELEETERNYERLKEIQVETKKDLDEVADQKSRLYKKVEEAGNLLDRENKMVERERDQKVFELDIHLQAQKEINKHIILFVDALMKNTTFRETVWRDHHLSDTVTNAHGASNYVNVETGHRKEITQE